MSSLEEQLEEQVQKIGILLEVMTDEINRTRSQRKAYIEAINEIDDYFEYSAESKNAHNKAHNAH